MTEIVLKEMKLNPNILQDKRYAYLFTVEDVNDKVAAGIPFRDAYKEVGMEVQTGVYESDTSRSLRHTHEGSIGNLCLEQIREKFLRHWNVWDVERVKKAEALLMQ